MKKAEHGLVGDEHGHRDERHGVDQRGNNLDALEAVATSLRLWVASESKAKLPDKMPPTNSASVMAALRAALAHSLLSSPPWLANDS
jgi:hypothetical protein